MKSLVDELGMLEAERARLKSENETLKLRLAQQKALIDENRAERGRLMKRIEQQAELIGTYKNHFRSFHGSADSIQTQERSLDEAQKKAEPTAEATPEPEPSSLMGKITRLGRVMARDEKTTNGATNGHAAA